MLDPTFEYHPEAMQEAWDTFHWYSARSDVAADDFWEELHVARRAVTQQPETWTPYLHGTRCFSLKRYPYGLVYIERGDRIIGIAVAHFKQRPGYWRDRLADG